MNIRDLITKENLKILRMVHDRQEFLFQVGVIASLDDPVGVAPSHDAAARRATRKGLLMRVGDGYGVTEEGMRALRDANEPN